jgi:hypothetical protein
MFKLILTHALATGVGGGLGMLLKSWLSRKSTALLAELKTKAKIEGNDAKDAILVKLKNL